MKQKVQIDFLDVSLYEKEDEDGGIVSIEKPTSSELQLKNSGIRWWKTKIILTGVCFVAVFLSSSVAFYFYNQQPAKTKSDTSKKGYIAFNKTKTSFEFLQDFIINFKDINGKERIFVCTLALETNPGVRTINKNNYFEIRKSTYKILKKYSLGKLSLIREKDRLKDEISSVINKQIGTNIVSRIYFTKYIIL